MEVISSGARTNLAWKRYVPQWTRVEFLNHGHASVDGLEFRHACSELIDSVIRRLASSGIEDTLLQQEWDAIQATEVEEEELQFCQTAAGLGWDPYDLLDSERDEIFQLAHELGAFVGEAVQALNASSLRAQSSAIVSAIEDAGKNGLPLDSLRSFHVDQGDDLRNALPWRVGYGWARRLRQKLDVGGQPLASTEELADALGEDQVGVDMAIQSVESLTRAPLVDGLVSLNSDETASFAFRPAGEAGRRFSFCRALAEFLASPHTGSLITKSHSERQQRNRAFAAEFLAPSKGLREKVNRSVVYGEEMDELAEEYGVSWLVIKHQIENHGIAQLAEPAFGQSD